MQTLFNTLPYAWLLSLSALLGLCIGSFLNVVIYRSALRLQLIPPITNINLLLNRSFCPKCQTTIAWYDNIPLVSFLLLKGQCRACRQPISWQYPFIELFTLIITAVVFTRFGISEKTLAAWLICWWLIPLAVLDFNYFILPNTLTLSLLALGLLFNSLGLFSSLSDALIGALAGYVSFACIDTLYFMLRGQHGLGGGDWKLFAALGACFGWQSLLLILLIASFSATLVGLSMMATRRATLQSALPFGVFLSFAGLIVLLSDVHLSVFTV